MFKHIIEIIFAWLFGDYVKEKLVTANNALEDALKAKRKVTVLDVGNIDYGSECYVHTLSDIWENGCFQYELMLTKDMVISKLISDGEENARNLQSMLKGIDIFVTRFQECYVQTNKNKVKSNV